MTMYPSITAPPAPQPMPQHIPPTGPPAPPPPPYEEDQHAAAARGYGMVYAYSPYAYPGQVSVEWYRDDTGRVLTYMKPPQQPMMAGAPPSGPPGNYIPSPFLQPMHYPPMPPNGHRTFFFKFSTPFPIIYAFFVHGQTLKSLLEAMYAPPPSMGNMPREKLHLSSPLHSRTRYLQISVIAPQQYMQPPPPGAYPPPPNGAGRGSMPPTPMPPHAHAYAYHQSPQRVYPF